MPFVEEFEAESLDNPLWETLLSFACITFRFKDWPIPIMTEILPELVILM